MHQRSDSVNEQNKASCYSIYPTVITLLNSSMGVLVEELKRWLNHIAGWNIDMVLFPVSLRVQDAATIIKVNNSQKQPATSTPNY